MVRITIRKPRTKDEDWAILKNNRKIDTEISKPRAQDAARFFREYFSHPKNKRREWVRKAKF